MLVTKNVLDVQVLVRNESFLLRILINFFYSSEVHELRDTDIELNL